MPRRSVSSFVAKLNRKCVSRLPKVPPGIISKPLLRRLGADFEAHTQVADLSLAQCQLVEIVKALSLDARVVIMDEPTSSLTSRDGAAPQGDRRAQGAASGSSSSRTA